MFGWRTNELAGLKRVGISGHPLKAEAYLEPEMAVFRWKPPGVAGEKGASQWQEN